MSQTVFLYTQADNMTLEELNAFVTTQANVSMEAYYYGVLHLWLSSM